MSRRTKSAAPAPSGKPTVFELDGGIPTMLDVLDRVATHLEAPDGQPGWDAIVRAAMHDVRVGCLLRDNLVDGALGPAGVTLLMGVYDTVKRMERVEP